MPGVKLSVALFTPATVVTVIFAACPQLRPGFDAGNPMNTWDIIIIYILTAACLMMVLCKISTDAIVLTSTFRSGMSSPAIVLETVTLGTTFIDAHLAEIKDIAGGIPRAYPMLLVLMLFGTCSFLRSQGATAPLIIPLVVTLGAPTWAIPAPYVVVTGVFALPTYPISLAAMKFDIIGITCMGKCVLSYPFMLPGLGGIIAGIAFGFVITPMITWPVLLRLDGLL